MKWIPPPAVWTRALFFRCRSVHIGKRCWCCLNFSVCIAYPDRLIHQKYRHRCHAFSSLEARIIGRQVHLLVIWHFPWKSHCLFADNLAWILTENPCKTHPPHSNMPDRISFFLFFFLFHFKVFIDVIANVPLYYNADLFFWKMTCGDKQNSILLLMRDISLPCILCIKIVISFGQNQFLSDADCVQ